MSTYHTFGSGTYALNSSISSTQTSITLSSFLEPVSGTPYTMVLLNTDIAYGTIAPKTVNSEFISFTGITQNVDGTATLTGVTRGLQKKYPFTSSATFKLAHSGQSVFIISNPPQVYEEYAALKNDNAFLGDNTGPNPTTAQSYVTRDWILALINGGAISVNNVVESGTAGTTIAAGNLIYFSETDNEWLLCDADTLATVFNVKLGIAQGSGTNGNPITNGVLTYGSYTTSGLTQGDLCYASNTAGGINSGTSGTTPRVIGIAKSTTALYFDPNFQNTLYNYAVDAVGTDSYAITLAGAFNAYYPGMPAVFKVGTANTGPATLNVNGLGAKALVRNGSTALITGDILSGQIIYAVYDGISFQVQTPSSNIPVGSTGQRTYVYVGTFDLTNASNTNVVITHSLGTIPSLVEATFKYYAYSVVSTFPRSDVSESDGTAIIASNGSVSSYASTVDYVIASNAQTDNAVSTSVIGTLYSVSNAAYQEFTLSTITTTQLTLVNTKTGSPTGTGTIKVVITI